jgi:hypothetical protein
VEEAEGEDAKQQVQCLRHAWRTVRCAGVDAISTWLGGECCDD